MKFSKKKFKNAIGKIVSEKNGKSKNASRDSDEIGKSNENGENSESRTEEKDKGKLLNTLGNVKNKVGAFFDPEPQKERVLRHEDFNAAGDVYYASVSAFYKIAERLLWLVLALFTAFSIGTNYKEITFDNFFYLMKDFSSASDSNVPNYQTLSYDSDSRQIFSLYRGGLVSASPSAVSVFTAGGRRTLRSNTEYYSPSIVCCDKYVLVYDGAGSAFSVYNSFSKVYSEGLESPITNAKFAQDGSFAVATKNDDGKSVIYLYGKDIKRRGEISGSRYVFDMSIDSEEHRFATVSYQAENGQGITTLSVYDIESSQSAKKLASVNIEGEFPIGCAFLKNGKIGVLTNLSVRIYDKNYRETAKNSFYGSSITAFSVGEYGIAAVVSSGEKKTAFAFDKSGDLVYNNPITENVSAIEQRNGYLFLRTVNGVTRLDTKKGNGEFLPSESGKMLIYDEDTALVCGSARAEYLVFGKRK